MPNLASVVTSVTIVETTDEEARQRYKLLFSSIAIVTSLLQIWGWIHEKPKEGPSRRQDPKVRVLPLQRCWQNNQAVPLNSRNTANLTAAESKFRWHKFVGCSVLKFTFFLGLQQLAWLIGRNETNWRPTEQPRRTLPTTPTTPKTPLTMATNSIGNNSQVLYDDL